MCWFWPDREPDAAKQNLLAPYASDSADSMEDFLGVPLQSVSDSEASGSSDLVCRVCYHDVLEPITMQTPRDAFSLTRHIAVRLCGCRASAYHVQCLYDQLSDFANKKGWSRMCIVCERPWTFLPRVQFKVSPHFWTWWDGAGFKIRQLDTEKDVFTDETVEGIQIRVGPGTESTPRGPIIPLAEAYTTVEVHFDDEIPAGLEHYLNSEGVATFVPWSILYSFLFPER